MTHVELAPGGYWGAESKTHPESMQVLWVPEGLVYGLFWQAPEPEEVEGIRQGRIELGLWDKQPGCMMFGVCIREGKREVLPWAEIAFSPHTGMPQGPVPGYDPDTMSPKATLKVSLVLVDANDAKILVVRQGVASPAWTKACAWSVRSHLKRAFDPRAFEASWRAFHRGSGTTQERMHERGCHRTVLLETT